MKKYGLSDALKIIRVDCDIATDPPSIYIEFLRALGANVDALGEDNLTTLKNQLLIESQKFGDEIDLVVIFDNFNRSLQHSLGEDFLNFLYGLRNRRPKLNITYIFMTNLDIDLTGFYRVERLFDQGIDHSICWLSLLNEKDAFFSIDRQWYRAGGISDKFSQVMQEKVKKRIYELGGGHALLGKYLSHLMLSGEITVDTKPEKLLEHKSIRSACAAIWEDLEQYYKNFLIDVAQEALPTKSVGNSVKEVLQNYGVLQGQTLFSPLFESFLKTQQKANIVLDVSCGKDRTKLVIKTIDHRQLPVTLNELSPKKRSLLCYLAQNLSETCTREQLIEIGWSSDDPDEPKLYYQALSRQMDDLRKWLGNHKEIGRYLEIKTVWGVGYVLVVKG
ncbi:MAG: winged helix-turn-helix domain-containing protein [Anaerolineae bacterium]|nr:winged helix-turn-helix domain-containing protein [Anaerolineae bacterium]